MEIEPESYDVVTAYNVLLYMKNQEEVLKKYMRFLKPVIFFFLPQLYREINLSKDSVKKFWKSKLHLIPYVAFDTPISLMRKIRKTALTILKLSIS